MTDIERALADIAEVRERLGHAQRFRGYSGLAAIASGLFALCAGVLQREIVPHIATVHQGHLYFAVWFLCCAAAMLVNYGAIAHWYVNDAGARDRWQTATAGFSMLPALVLAAAISFAFLQQNRFSELPAVWYGCYGVGLLASRLIVPRGVTPIGLAFLAAGCALAFAPPALALAPWVPAIGFGAGQMAIGWLVLRERP